MRYSILSLFALFAGAAAVNPRNGFDISSYAKDLVAKMDFYANGGKSSGTRRRMAALMDIKQVLVPENASKLKMAIQTMQQKTATSTANLSPSVAKAITQIQSTIQENETDLQFLQRFAALHLSAAIHVPNKVMKDGMRRMQEEVVRCGLDLGQEEPEAAAAAAPDAAAVPEAVDHHEDDISRLMDFIVKFLEDVGGGGGGLRSIGDIKQNADGDTAVGAQQTQDEFVLLLFSVGIVIFAFLPQFLFTPVPPLPVPLPPAVPFP